MYRIRQIVVGTVVMLVLLSLVGCGRRPPTPDYGMNEAVEGEEWRITAVSAENKGSEFERGGRTIRAEQADANLLYVRVAIESVEGAELGVSYLSNVEVRDNTGEMTHWWLAGLAPAVYYDSEAQEGNPIYVVDPGATVEYVFVVSDDATTFDLLWMDLPAIRLTVE